MRFYYFSDGLIWLYLASHGLIQAPRDGFKKGGGAATCAVGYGGGNRAMCSFPIAVRPPLHMGVGVCL